MDLKCAPVQKFYCVSVYQCALVLLSIIDKPAGAINALLYARTTCAWCYQALGQIPTVSIDKTDGCQVYLSKESAKADIVSAKSSEMNILIPDDSGEFVSLNFGLQFRDVEIANIFLN